MDPNRDKAAKAKKPQPVRRQLEARIREFSTMKSQYSGQYTRPGSQNRNK